MTKTEELQISTRQFIAALIEALLLTITNQLSKYHLNASDQKLAIKNCFAYHFLCLHKTFQMKGNFKKLC